MKQGLVLILLLLVYGFTQAQNAGKKPNSNKPTKIDTVGLHTFWLGFQQNLLNKKNDPVVAVLDFPVHALFPVLFKYACDCDTGLYIKNEKKYNTFDITPSNIKQYFNFIFSDTLIKIVQQITTEDLLKKGIINKTPDGLMYEIFPKEYIKVPCPNDHLYMFNISKTKNIWRLS